MLTSSSLMLRLKKASEADAAAISALAEKIWRIHYTPIIGSEQVEYMLGNLHSPAKVQEQMLNGQIFLFINRDEQPIGYLAWSKPASDELFIHKFYIEQSERGRGLGKQVFKEILELNPDVKTIRLTVNRKNYKSINFYYRVGFVIEEVKDFDIGGGYFMNDFVMKWSRM